MHGTQQYAIGALTLAGGEPGRDDDVVVAGDVVAADELAAAAPLVAEGRDGRA